MADATSGTLTPNVVTPVSVRGWAFGVNVVNRSFAALPGSAVWVRLDGTDPTVGGADCFVVLGARNFPVAERLVDVRMVSDQACAYTVEGRVPTT